MAPVERLLRAGPLSLVFDEGQVRWIRCGDKEVLRAIYVGVRDKDWNTIPGRLSDLIVIEEAAGGFRVTFRCRHDVGPIGFVWDAEIRGDASGTIRFAMDGEATRTFERNRIGLCVLHPLESAGQPCEVDRADGGTTAGVFPRFVAPHQPFLGIRTLRVPVARRLSAEVQFEGDVFEMEDQRNWGDASFKTYGTPLALPRPVVVREGTRVAQAVTIRLVGEGRPRPVLVKAESPVRLEVEDAGRGSVPVRGLGHAGGSVPGDRDRRLIRALRPDHVRFDLRTASADLRSELRQAVAVSEACGAPLHLALFVGDDPAAELRALAEAAAEVRPPVALWMLFRASSRTTSYGLVAEARAALAGINPRARFGGGTDGFFVDLNRQRPSAADFDQASYALSPQAHLEDDATILENLTAVASVVESARAFVGSCPLALSPVSLRPRPAAEAVPEAARDDPRQKTLFAAAWTAGLLAAALRAGFASLTLFEPTGPRGLMDDGLVFPAYHVLADVADFEGGAPLAVSTDAPGRVGILALRREARIRALAFNLTARPQEARIAGLGGGGTARMLDEASLEEAGTRPEEFRSRPGDVLPPGRGGYLLRLGPYAVARVDSVV
jgi:hypothetical protein